MKTKFIYNDNGKPIGKVDEGGSLYTMSGRLSYPYYNHGKGVAVSKAHQEREFYAGNTEWDEDLSQE